MQKITLDRIVRRIKLWPLVGLVPLLAWVMYAASADLSAMHMVWVIVVAFVALIIGSVSGAWLLTIEEEERPSSAHVDPRLLELARRLESTRTLSARDLEPLMGQIKHVRSLLELLSSAPKPAPAPKVAPVVEFDEKRPGYTKLIGRIERIASKQKGDGFEEFMVERLSHDQATLFYWRGDKLCLDENGHAIWPLSTRWPDLEWRCDVSSRHYAVECKWRSSWRTNDHGSTFIQVAKDAEQLERYRSYGEHVGRPIDVFIALGVGGTPRRPDELYIIPLTERWLARQPKTHTHVIVKHDASYYEVSTEHTFQLKVFNGNASLKTRR